jgi:glycerol-3-phosphate dehydrogenase (NAD(P)+)
MLCVNLSEVCGMRNETAIAHLKKHKHNPNYLSSVEFETKTNKKATLMKQWLC